MITLFLFLGIIILLLYVIRNKIVLRIDTFFRKGFKKNDDDYGIYCFCR